MHRRRRVPALFLCAAPALAIVGCQAAPPAEADVPAPLSREQRASLEEAVMEADRDFERSSAERGLDGWLAHMAEDAVRVDLHGEIAQGHEAIRRMDRSLFEDPELRFTWEPTDAGIFADGTTAFTRGRYRLLGPASGATGDTVLARGAYLTLWRLEARRWKVILDTGAPDPAG